MVRFIIKILLANCILKQAIYIPIWLDLLCEAKFSLSGGNIYLHSNMVRFIMTLNYVIEKAKEKFTFQYG